MGISSSGLLSSRILRGRLQCESQMHIFPSIAIITHVRHSAIVAFFLTFAGPIVYWVTRELVLARYRPPKKTVQTHIFKEKFLHIPGQVYSQNLRNRLDLSSSTEGPDTEDNNYLGYSLAIGDFTGSGRADLAVGMPRSANLTGKVKSCSKITSRYNHYHILRWCCLPGSDCSICTT